MSEITLGAAKKNVETAVLLRTKETLAQAQQQAAEERMAAERLRDELDARERALQEATEERAAMERRMAELQVCVGYNIHDVHGANTTMLPAHNILYTQARLENTSVHAAAGPRHAPSSGALEVSTPKSMGRLSMRGTPVSMHEPVSTPPSSSRWVYVAHAFCTWLLGCIHCFPAQDTCTCGTHVVGFLEIGTYAQHCIPSKHWQSAWGCVAPCMK